MKGMTANVRVRYAPSPTGEPHVGNIRTAIFNWLFARHTQGTFIFRLEDTDQSRRVEGAMELLMDSLKWLGLDWEEGPDIGGKYGPYVQSERPGLYRRIVEQLIEGDYAYHCYCSPERLAKVREEQTRRKENPGYDRHCRDLSEGERLEMEKSGVTPVVRFKMPLDGTTTVNDLVRGEVTFENRLVDDYVMLKSDGFPTYHLANVVDDYLMEITHVMRAEEWLPSVPRHLQLYRALEWQPPQFAHLPIILAPDRSKLSKRHGATSILEYRELGYLPHTMLNFLTLLGWSLDDKTELFSREQLIEHFSIERIARAGAIFNIEKLQWMNGHYIRQMSHEELADALLDFWRHYPPPELPKLPDRSFVLQVVPLIQERLKTLRDAVPLITFFFKEELDYDTGELVQKGADTQQTRRALDAAYVGLSSLPSFDAESMEGLLRPMTDELGLKTRQFFGTLRVATTGLSVAPPLFQTMEVLGKERTLASIQKAIDRL
jgi:glutamyl-tRNA synthetase